MGIVQRQLGSLGIAQRHEDVFLDGLDKFAGAAVMNSWTPGVPVSAIGSVSVPEAPEFLDALRAAFNAEPDVALIT